MNVMALVVASPAPIPVAAPEPAADIQVAPHGALTARAWEHSYHAGATYDMSYHGLQCVNLVQSWKDRWSTIDVMRGFQCEFYINPSCEFLNYRVLYLEGPATTILKLDYPDYNDKISSYRSSYYINTPIPIV